MPVWMPCWCSGTMLSGCGDAGAAGRGVGLGQLHSRELLCPTRLLCALLVQPECLQAARVHCAQGPGQGKLPRRSSCWAPQHPSWGCTTHTLGVSRLPLGMHHLLPGMLQHRACTIFSMSFTADLGHNLVPQVVIVFLMVTIWWKLGDQTTTENVTALAGGAQAGSTRCCPQHAPAVVARAPLPLPKALASTLPPAPQAHSQAAVPPHHPLPLQPFASCGRC